MIGSEAVQLELDPLFVKPPSTADEETVKSVTGFCRRIQSRQNVGWRGRF
jgi:hypothetical protein